MSVAHCHGNLFNRSRIHADMCRKPMRTVLIVDDNPAVGEALSLLLSLHDIRPLVALNQDMNFTADTTSGEEGVELFRAIRESHPDLPVILLTAWTHLETAVELVK